MATEQGEGIQNSNLLNSTLKIVLVWHFARAEGLDKYIQLWKWMLKYRRKKNLYFHCLLIKIWPCVISCPSRGVGKYDNTVVYYTRIFRILLPHPVQLLQVRVDLEVMRMKGDSLSNISSSYSGLTLLVVGSYPLQKCSQRIPQPAERLFLIARTKDVVTQTELRGDHQSW